MYGSFLRSIGLNDIFDAIRIRLINTAQTRIYVQDKDNLDSFNWYSFLK